MIYLAAIVVGLIVGAALGFGVGLGAATVYTEMYGANSGGSAMGGFFYIGPFGLLAGFLLGAAVFLRYSDASRGLTTGLFWAGGIVFAIGLIAFAIPVVNTLQERASRAPFDLELEFEVPASQIQDYKDQEKFHWGYSGESPEEKADSPFFNEQCANGVCILTGAIQMTDFPSRRLAIFEYEGKRQSFPIAQAGRVTQATDWSEWQQGDQVRFRWMMRKAK
ncbi:hypothetical protein [Bryobacter aggregatus]|uniref:hypothetical protein n=1 Tax=Bryobacter aggregatus TaxID=360054 RepID=UPI0004E0F854|nr:hypothetical protein [Bryobacter aggregatus]